tara:strand:+ start:358 stop:519 length:162 start_codon:yes stop_codon:yes gene_type:complete
MASRGKRLIKLLEGLVTQEHLYTDDELKSMKGQIRVLKEELAIIENKLSKGFK